jgi:DNA modification methylase
VTAIRKEERIGGQRLILGDCLEVMPLLGKVDAVVTDPPYGTAEAWQGGNKHGWGRQDGLKAKRNAWDAERPSQKVFDLMLSISKEQIIWGGNYFADMLPPSMRWLAWDKCQRNFTLADFELAWTSQKKAARAFNLSRSQAGKDGKENHATPKPISLMEWCLGFLPDARTILDPFMGSGTTLVACQRLGRQGIGIELDPDYFEIACRRVDEATRQPDMFVQQPPKPVQEGMDL